jgi:hypothetical protein
MQYTIIKLEIQRWYFSMEYTTAFKKRPNFLNSAPSSKEGALRLLSAPSGMF